MARPPNVALFGMIRKGKGIEAALRLAARFRTAVAPSRVVIAGKPCDSELLREIMVAAYGDTILRAVIGGNWQTILEIEKHDANLEQLKAWNIRCREMRGPAETTYLAGLDAWRQLHHTQTIAVADHGHCNMAHVEAKLKDAAIKNKKTWVDSGTALKALIGGPPNPPESLPVDIHLDVPAETVNALFRTCKYACKDDEKGMADNASSIVSVVANGCITFAPMGNVTPHEFSARTGKKADLEEFESRFGEGVAVTDSPTLSLDAGGAKLTFDYTGRFRDAVILPQTKKDSMSDGEVFQGIDL